MPLPTDPRTVFLGGIFVLGALAALYVAAEIVLPVVLAIGPQAAAATYGAGAGPVARAARDRRIAGHSAADRRAGRLGQLA